MDKEEKIQLICRMTKAENKIDGVYYYFARHLGINENKLALLYALDDGMPHSQKDVSEEWMIPRTTINSIVRGMMAEGYIVLDSDSHTKEKALMLTEQGQAYARKLLQDIYDAEEQAMTETIQKYSTEFVDAIEFFGERLHESYHAMTKKQEEDSQ